MKIAKIQRLYQGQEWINDLQVSDEIKDKISSRGVEYLIGLDTSELGNQKDEIVKSIISSKADLFDIYAYQLITSNTDNASDHWLSSYPSGEERVKVLTDLLTVVNEGDDYLKTSINYDVELFFTEMMFQSEEQFEQLKNDYITAAKKVGLDINFDNITIDEITIGRVSEEEKIKNSREKIDKFIVHKLGSLYNDEEIPTDLLHEYSNIKENSQNYFLFRENLQNRGNSDILEEFEENLFSHITVYFKKQIESSLLDDYTYEDYSMLLNSALKSDELDNRQRVLLNAALSFVDSRVELQDIRAEEKLDRENLDIDTTLLIFRSELSGGEDVSPAENFSPVPTDSNRSLSDKLMQDMMNNVTGNNNQR
jgi:hypothetical protein